MDIFSGSNVVLLSLIFKISVDHSCGGAVIKVCIDLVPQSDVVGISIRDHFGTVSNRKDSLSELIN